MTSILDLVRSDRSPELFLKLIEILAKTSKEPQGVKRISDKTNYGKIAG